MNHFSKILILLACLPGLAGAAVPSPEKLLPDDTLGVMTVPDCAKARAAYGANASSQLWRDPALKPFKEKLLNKIADEFIKPLERELGVQLQDYADLAQGQLTLAVLQNGWQGKQDPLPAWLLLVDTRDKSGQLKTNLATLRKKWLDSGKKLKPEKIRDIEFSTLTISGDEVAHTLEKSLAEAKPNDADDPKDKAEGKKSGSSTTITIGQSESLLIVGNNSKAIEKILARQSGGAVPALGEQAAFDTDYQARLRNALIYGWVHFKPIAAVLSRLASESAGDRSPEAPDLSKAITSTGINGLKSVSFSLNETPEGSFGEIHLAAPADTRVGIFKMLVADAKDAHPPPFIPADAVKFQRFRLDLQKSWATLESMVTEISPQMGGGLKLILETAGKDKDPNFDLRKELIGNLGDDIISYQKIPRTNTLAGLSSAPSIYLFGSPNAEKLAAALKTITSLLPPQWTNLKERELLGKKIYSLTLPTGANADGSTSQRSYHYSASGGYLAVSTDEAILESYLRSSDNTGKTLRDSVGLADAAQKIGGMSTGMFGYENASETMRVTLGALKEDSGSIEKLLALTPFAPRIGGKDGKGLKDWVDFSLLPPFEQIAKYFYFTVYSGNATPDGIDYKVFSPTPPQLKK